MSALTLLSGCAASKEEYMAYIEAEKAKYVAERARYEALASIANNGDQTAKVVSSLMLGLDMSTGAGQKTGTSAPVSSSDTALKWASIIIPSVTQLGTASINARVAIRQSDNSAQVSMSTNGAFVNMAREIQAPGDVYNSSFNTGTAP